MDPTAGPGHPGNTGEVRMLQAEVTRLEAELADAVDRLIRAVQDHG